MKKIITLFLCIVILILLCSCYPFDDFPLKDIEGEFLVHYIDVGQGDCILIESDDDYVLIDAGEIDYENIVCQYLLQNEIESIDYVIATHPHSDHCGGLTKVIETIPCDNFITVETDQQTKTWLNVLYAVSNNNVNYIDAKVGDTYNFGNAYFEIMGPYGSEYDNYNDYSVVVKATYESTSFLFTGDCEKNAEFEMIKNGADLKADVLKVSHHGSTTSSSKDFLKAVSPTYSVIMCGKYNEYGHPHKEVLNYLKNMGVTTYRTDTMGTIIAVSNGENIEFFYENADSVPAPTALDLSKITFVGNNNSKKFHISTCEGAKNMNTENKVSFKTRDEAVNNGFSPCKTCNP